MPSSVPAALTALLAGLRGALISVDVFDGPPVTAQQLDYVCIGHDPADPLTATDAQQVPASLGNRSREETYDVVCSLACWSGDDDMAARRVRAFAILADIEDYLRTDITLGGAVRTAQLTSHALVQEQTQQGSSAGIRFRITCSARLT